MTSKARVMLRRTIQPENAAEHSKKQAVCALRWLIPIAVAVLFLGCEREVPEEEVFLPPTPVISVRPYWAVATESYSRVHSRPDTQSTISGHLRRGDVTSVASISTRTDLSSGRTVLWYQIALDDLSGWIQGGSLEFFESRRRALNSSRFMTRSAGPRDQEEAQEP